MTDYANSQWTGEMYGPIRILRYDVRDQIHYAPSTTVTVRTTYKNSTYRGPIVADQPKALIRIEDNTVHFVGRPQLQPTAKRHGRRTLLSVHEVPRQSGRLVLRVLYLCDCGAVDHVGLDDWRKAITSAHAGQCTACARNSRYRNDALPPKAARIAKQQAELARLPYRAQR